MSLAKFSLDRGGRAKSRSESPKLPINFKFLSFIHDCFIIHFFCLLFMYLMVKFLAPIFFAPSSRRRASLDGRKKLNYLQHIYNITSPHIFFPTRKWQKLYKTHMIIYRFRSIDFHSYKYDCVVCCAMCVDIRKTPGEIKKK